MTSQVLTLHDLIEICKEHNIPDDVRLLSDSGWECCETEVCGVWYSEIDNAIVLTNDSRKDVQDIIDEEAAMGQIITVDEYEVDCASWHTLTIDQTLKRLR